MLASFAEPKRVTPSDFGDVKQPQIAIGEESNLHVTFGKGHGIYVTSSDNAGISFSAPMKIGEVGKLALGMRRGPRIAATGRNVTVTAISHGDGNVYSWFSRDAGRSWSKPMTVNTVAMSAREGLHGMASDGKSKLIAVWLDLRNKKTELWSSVSDDGGETWNPNTRIYKSPDQTICECCHPSVIFTPTGEIVAMWRNWLNGSRDMYQSVSSDGGKTFSTAKKLGTGTWRIQGCPMDGGSVAPGEKAVGYVWRRERQIFATTDPSSETLLAESGIHPVIIPAEEGFFFLWQNEGNLYLKPSISDASQLLAANAGYAAAAWSPRNHKSVIVWEGSDGIYFLEQPNR